MNNHIYIYPGLDKVFQYLFYDIKDKSGISVESHFFLIKQISYLWKKIQSKSNFQIRYHKILMLLSLPFMPLNKLKNSEDNLYIFSNISINFMPIFLLNIIHANGGKVILYFIDSLSNNNSKVAYWYTKRFLFDAIYTFDQNDALANGFIFRKTMYSKLQLPLQPIKYDAVFIGSNKGRINIIKNIVKKCPKTNFYFDILGLPIQYKKGLFKNSIDLNYVDCIEKDLQSNCIIDIVTDPNQAGLSLRAFEAVVYNKRLITNNPSIKDFPYYDGKNIRYIDNYCDINDSFFKVHELVNYHYKGEFSPLYFLLDIVSRLGLDKKKYVRMDDELYGNS